jgi:FkbM family methyltransferase
MLKIEKVIENKYAEQFYNKFVNSNKLKFILGINERSKNIAENFHIDGFIDDYTSEKEVDGKKIYTTEYVPDDALVLVTSVIRPLTAEKRARQFQFQSLDYFSFCVQAEKTLEAINYWDGFEDDFKMNKTSYEWVYEQLADPISRNQFYNIINFRVSYDLYFMRGFEDKESEQYFEDFLNLSKGEVFVDIGVYDGYTSEQFIEHCPEYKAVYLFEPDKNNTTLAKQRLKDHSNIFFCPKGISNKTATLKFDTAGSASKISDNGEFEIEVDKLDNLINEAVTFIKMDIEGMEHDAIEGMEETIKKYHPKLAISVYHKADDLWRIPKQICDIRDDYNIYLRHYSEGLTETVMFFMPK